MANSPRRFRTSPNEQEIQNYMQSAAQSGDLASVDPRAVKRANSNYSKTRTKGIAQVTPESVTNKAGEKIHTGSDPVTGQPVKTVVGVDTALRDKAARLAKHEAESNALAMRKNQMEQSRLGFQPNWEATNDNFTKVQRDVKALEAKGIVRNPENGAFSRVDPKSGYHEDLTPFEAATHRKEAEDARLAYAAASKRHGELLPVAENFIRVKADIDTQKLKLAAQRLRIESDLPEDDGGVAEAMAKQAGLVEETRATAAAKQVEQAAMLPKPASGTSATQPPATPEIQDAFKALSGLAGATLAPQRNYTQIQRNGRWIASLDKDSDGSQSVTLRPEAAHDDDINRILTKAGTDGVPLYVKENPDRPRQAKETAWAAGLGLRKNTRRIVDAPRIHGRPPFGAVVRLRLVITGGGGIAVPPPYCFEPLASQPAVKAPLVAGSRA
jgi:hypothetical protein